jgi:hypothetical protein
MTRPGQKTCCERPRPLGPPAEHARETFEQNGVTTDQLKACAADGPDGTELPHCVKVYVPLPDRPHAMVFEIDRVAGRLRPV